MARTPAVLVTGSGGQLGRGLIDRLAGQAGRRVVALDIGPPPADIAPFVAEAVVGSVLDPAPLAAVAGRYDVDAVFHLAAFLSSKSETDPLAAHRLNVDGTLNLLEFARSMGDRLGRPVGFFFPSSIAAYGLPDAAAKARAGAVREDDFPHPATMYGANKRYGEELGRYYDRHYRRLDPTPAAGRVDFRGLRYPGLLAADSLPSGGTSDFAPEMIHAAARGEPYACFVRPDTRIPLMTMPDAVDAALALMAAPKVRLTRGVYNVSAFAPSAGELAGLLAEAFPGWGMTSVVHPGRQGIVDTWPADLDVSAARRDWGFSPRHDLPAALHDYLLPAVRRRAAGG